MSRKLNLNMSENKKINYKSFTITWNTAKHLKVNINEKLIITPNKLTFERTSDIDIPGCNNTKLDIEFSNDELNVKLNSICNYFINSNKDNKIKDDRQSMFSIEVVAYDNNKFKEEYYGNFYNNNISYILHEIKEIMPPIFSKLCLYETEQIIMYRI